MTTTADAETVQAAANQRAHRRYRHYQEQHYQSLNAQFQHPSAALKEQTAELRLLMDLHDFLLYRVLNDTSISVTIPHRPRSTAHAAAVANYVLDIDLPALGFPPGTTGVITAYTDHTYILDWSPR